MERGGGGLKLARERGRRVELGRGKGGGFKAGEGERERGKEFHSWGEREGGIIDGRGEGGHSKGERGEGGLKLGRERGGRVIVGEREGGSKLGREGKEGNSRAKHLFVKK